MNAEPEARTVPVALEWVDADAVGIDPDARTAPDLLTKCAFLLAELTLDASQVQLVITGDFVASVRQRSTTEHQQEDFNLRRNNGAVGGKTIQLAGGKIDVLMPAALFLVDLSDEEQRESDQIASRTIVHEAWHVAMAQAGEAEGSYEGMPPVRHNLLFISDQIIGEYRAEAAIAPDLRDVFAAPDCIDVLSTLRGDIERIVIEYQAHLDVGRLNYEVCQEIQTAWKMLAYVAANRVDEYGEFEALPDFVADHPLWQRMVGPHWQRLLDILGPIAWASQRIDRSELDAPAAQLAAECQAWLETIGFEWIDSDDGIQFWIRKWDLIFEEWPST